MKNLVFAILALGSASAFAAGTEAPVAASKAPVVSSAPAKAPLQASNKVTKASAKKACKEEGKTGKDLKSCVNEKLGKSKT